MISLSILNFLGLSLLSGAAMADGILWERDDSVPLVYINLGIRSGGGHDPVGMDGLSNFMGEMLMRGTRRRSKEQIDLELDRMGARLDFDTRTEFMVIRGAVLTSQLEPYLKLLTEILTEPSFPESEIKKLRAELISGLTDELGNDAATARKHFQKMLFGDHPYGRPILGSIKTIEKINRARVTESFNRTIRGNLFFASGIGNQDSSRIERWVEDLKKRRPGGKLPAPIAIPTLAQKRRYLIVDKPDRTQTQIIGGHLGIAVTDPDYYGAYVGNYAFGGGSFLSRMFSEIRVKRGWSYGANSGIRIARTLRSWEFSLAPASKDTPDALAYALKMIEDLDALGITSKEFEFSKTSLINNSKFSFNTPGKRIELALVEQAIELPPGFFRREEAEISKLGLQQVNRALAGLIEPKSLNIVVLGTASQIREPIAKALGINPLEIEVVPFNEL